MRAVRCTDFSDEAPNTNLRFVGHSSSYNALQLKLDRRFSNGFAMTTAFTYGKALGYQSEDGGLTFYINGERNWQRLNFDRKFNYIQSFVYQFPFGKGGRFATSGIGRRGLGRLAGKRRAVDSERISAEFRRQYVRSQSAGQRQYAGPLRPDRDPEGKWPGRSRGSTRPSAAAAVTTGLFRPAAEPAIRQPGSERDQRTRLLEPGRLDLPFVPARRANDAPIPRRGFQRGEHPVVEQPEYGLRQHHLRLHYECRRKPLHAVRGKGDLLGAHRGGRAPPTQRPHVLGPGKIDECSLESANTESHIARPRQSPDR